MTQVLNMSSCCRTPRDTLKFMKNVLLVTVNVNVTVYCSYLNTSLPTVCLITHYLHITYLKSNRIQCVDQYHQILKYKYLY